jgi:hypothetical protein
VRGPSSHWTSTTTNGVRSFHAGRTGGWTTTHERSVALPLASAHSLSVERQFAHIGPGGWRQLLHAVQRWKRSSRLRPAAQYGTQSWPPVRRSKSVAVASLIASVAA